MAEIKLVNVSFVYGEGTKNAKKALDGISLTLGGSMITGLIGHTGSGKSTLVQLLNGLLKPTSGTVLLDGKDIWSEPKKMRDVRSKVGLVMQYPEYQLFDETVRSDIAFGPKNMGLAKEDIDARVKLAADFVGLGADLLDKSPFDLSGGQKRRAAIAGVIAMTPDVLVLDEPAAGLDPGGRCEILGKIREYQRESGISVIIVSHSMEDMALYCDRIVVLGDGTVRMDGTPGEIFGKYDELISVGLDVPQITHVARALKERGIDIGDGVYTVAEAKKRIVGYVKEHTAGGEIR